MRNKIILFLLQALVLNCISSFTFAQTKDQNSYVSAVDADLSIKTILLAPFSDNLTGIYSEPLHRFVKETLEERKQWEVKEIDGKGFDSLSERPKEVAQLYSSQGGQALLTSRITKGPKGLSFKITLFLGKEGHPFAIEESTQLQIFETEKLKSAYKESLAKLFSKIPYQGVILSRRGLEVTINLGSIHGLKIDDEIQVIQILAAKRHPKLKTVIATDKEILGKIKLTKVDEALSFGQIVLERELLVLKPEMKVQASQFVFYPQPILTADSKTSDSINSRPDKDISIGGSPQEWLPQHPPQFGKVGVLGSLMQYNQSLSLTGSGGVGASASLAPTLTVNGEAWISQEWTAGASISQSVFNVSNPVPGSSPSTLNMQLSQFNMFGVYNFNLSDSFWGPKLILGAGIGSTEFIADNGSPLALTSMKYGGLYMRIGGSTPIDERQLTKIEAHLQYYLTPSLTEGSVNSGSAEAVKISEFTVLLSQAWKQNMSFTGSIDFNSYSSSFTGSGSRSGNNATNISHNFSRFNFGFEYLF